MEKKLYQQFEEIHTDHWWFRARLKILSRIFDKYLSYLKNNSPEAEILDVGCGTGSYFSVLGNFGSVSGVESSAETIEDLKKRGVPNKVFFARLPDMKLGRKFDAVTAFEILEHVEDDRGSFRDIAGHLNEGGILIGTVPAFRWLWSKHDELAHHKRRYTKKDLEIKLREAGFRVEKISYYNTLLFPLAATVRLLKKTILKRFVPVSDFSIKGGPLDNVFEFIFELEKFLVPVLNLPFGFSLIFIARK